MKRSIFITHTIRKNSHEEANSVGTPDLIPYPSGACPYSETFPFPFEMCGTFQTV